MTELETLQRAKMYLDKLANGIDPLTDQPAADSDVINQVRISRCLFYVSDVLRQVIENGGISQQRSNGLMPFAITPEEKQRISLAPFPLRISQIAQRISDAARHPGMAALTANPILNWLEINGLLEKRLRPNGKSGRLPTAEGQRLGICEEEQDTPYGLRSSVQYNENAQRYIIDHLEDILALRDEKLRGSIAPEASRTP